MKGARGIAGPMDEEDTARATVAYLYVWPALLHKVAHLATLCSDGVHGLLYISALWGGLQ